MPDETTTDAHPRRRRAGTAVGLLGAGAVAGAVLAGTMSASAADGTTSSTDTSSATSDATAQQRGGPQRAANSHSSSPVRSDEKALSASDAAKVKAAALKALPGGTVYRVETDAGDGVYEAHMTKADGTEVTVKLDKNFKVTAVESGMGKGDPKASGQPGGSTRPTGAA
jgi:uncharacterized membrane protein YkoI